MLVQRKLKDDLAEGKVKDASQLMMVLRTDKPIGN